MAAGGGRRDGRSQRFRALLDELPLGTREDLRGKVGAKKNAKGKNI